MNKQIKFGTDGWRAIIAKEFTVENVARLSYGLSRWIKEQNTENRVVIGHDCRFGGNLFSRTVASVLLQEGIEVLFADRIVTTPMLAMAARDLECAAGVMITASHNPPSYNGYKLKSAQGGPMRGEALQIIESYIPDSLSSNWNLIDIESQPAFKEIDIETPYVEAIAAAFDLDRMRANAERFAYDAMYGSGQFVMKSLFPEMSHFRCEHNPHFFGLSPEPIARNLDACADFLKAQDELDFCLVNDGDADRIGLMDGDGNFIDSHHIILLLIHYLVKYKGQSGKVVTAFSTVNKVHKLCELYNLPLEVVKIGFKYASAVMIQEPVMLAGEESGGIAVDTHIPERDGVWMGLMIMEFMALSGRSINELILEVYNLVGPFVFLRNDLRLSEEKKQSVVERCRLNGFSAFGDFEVERVEDLDGWKYILNENSWVMIRPSGTEPVLRVYVESDSEDAAQRILNAALQEIDR